MVKRAYNYKVSDGVGEDKARGLGLLARLTLVQWGWHAALHPWGVVIHDVDSDVGVPV